MSEKELQRFCHYEDLMKEARKSAMKKAVKAKGLAERPSSCAKCPYCQPDFKFRKCLFTRCPYGRDAEIFRKRPLRREKVARTERSLPKDPEIIPAGCKAGAVVMDG